GTHNHIAKRQSWGVRRPAQINKGSRREGCGAMKRADNHTPPRVITRDTKRHHSQRIKRCGVPLPCPKFCPFLIIGFFTMTAKKDHARIGSPICRTIWPNRSIVIGFHSSGSERSTRCYATAGFSVTEFHGNSLVGQSRRHV